MDPTPPQNGEFTNHARWRYWCKDLPSPVSFVDFAFYFVVAAYLQRRVWIPPTHDPTFSNPYTVLIGGAGVGKGMIIKRALKVLKYHRLIPPNEQKFVEGAPKSEDPELSEAAAQANYDRAKEIADGFGIKRSGSSKKETFEKPTVLQMGADATSYEAMVTALANSYRYTDYSEFNEKLQKKIGRLYGHSSLVTCLEEGSSLFRKRSEDVCKLMLNAYDCGDYDKDTKTQGKDGIRRMCLCFMCGTTPSFMEDAFRDNLLTDGFASRTLFIYESKSRVTDEFFLPQQNALQDECEQHIYEHVKKLLPLYGEVILGPGVKEFLNDWWKSNRDKKPNTSGKMEDYYSRKRVHIMKMAMAIHFGESTEMMMQVESFQKALKALEEVEPKMHFALVSDTKNPLNKVMKKMSRFMKSLPNQRATFKTLFAEMFPELPTGKKEDLEHLLSFMIETEKIATEDIPNEKLGTSLTYYRLTE